MPKLFDIQLTPADRKQLLHAYRKGKDHLQCLRAHVHTSQRAAFVLSGTCK